jgi:hypothetical protein
MEFGNACLFNKTPGIRLALCRIIMPVAYSYPSSVAP